MKVVYGHTDSIYCQVDSVEEAQENLGKLNDHVRKFFPNLLELDEHPVVLEFEKYFESLGVGCVKNRNAGLITWKDGKFLDDKEFMMTGFTAKRVSETKLAKEVQIAVLNMWVENKDEAEIVEFLRDKYYTVLSGQIPITDILKRSRFREERFKVKCSNCKRKNDFASLTNGACCNNMTLQTLEGKRPTIGAGIEGVVYYNSVNDVPIKDSYLFLRVRANWHDVDHRYFHPIKQEYIIPNYVAGLTESDFDCYVPDWKHYANSIMKKADPIFRAMGWNVMQIQRDTKQSSLEEWF
jgi:hypothetical protein